MRVDVRVLQVLQDAEAIDILDALKPGFSSLGLIRRQKVNQLLRRGEKRVALDKLMSLGLVERQGENWVVPGKARRFAYQLVVCVRDESTAVHEIARAATGLGIDPRETRWLDLGCGSGALLRTARRLYQVETLGTDLDSEALELARMADLANSSPGDYRQCPSHCLDIEPRSCGVVCSMVAFQHFRLRETLLEIDRVLTKPGLVFLRLHGPGYYLDLAARYLRQGKFPVYAVQCLLHGFIVECGGPQDLRLQDGWLKLELPIRPSFARRALATIGIETVSVTVAKKIFGTSVFFDYIGRSG